MAKLKISAKNALAEQLAQVASWRLSEVRNRVLKPKPEERVEALYVINAGEAVPSKQLEERLNAYESNPSFDLKKVREEIIAYSVERAVLIYCGFWNQEKIHFVADHQALAECAEVDWRQELRLLSDYAEKIAAETDIAAERRREFSRALDRLIGPEFDRLDLRLARMEGTLFENTHSLIAMEADLTENTHSIVRMEGNLTENTHSIVRMEGNLSENAHSIVRIEGNLTENAHSIVRIEGNLTENTRLLAENTQTLKGNLDAVKRIDTEHGGLLRRIAQKLNI